MIAVYELPAIGNATFRLEVERGMAPQHRGMLAAELGLDEDADVFEVEGTMAIRDIMELTDLEEPDLHDAPFHPADNAAMLVLELARKWKAWGGKANEERKLVDRMNRRSA